MKQRVARARVCFFGGLLVLALSLPGLAAQVAEAVGPSVFSVRFEEGEAAGLWSANPQGGAKASVRVEPGPGRGRSLRVEKSGVQGFVQWQSAPVSVETGTSYRVSAWLNTLPWDRRPGGGTPTAASVYFMVSQFGGGKGQPARSNSFGPVRPFYSSGSQWEKLEMAFQTRPDTERVTLSLIFTHDAVDLLVDDICLERQGKKEYRPRFESPVAEQLLSLEEAKKILESRPRATAEVRRVGERPRLFLDGHESYPAFYVGNAWGAKRSQVGDFSKAGVKVTFIPYILGRGVYGDFGVWSGPGQLDFSEVDEMLWRVLRADPHGYIMFYLATDPYPGWASENNLDDVVTDPDGNRIIVDMHFLRWDKTPPKAAGGKKQAGHPERYGHSYVSQRLRLDTGEVLKRFAEHIRSSLPGKAVIGYHVIGGNDGQMFQWDDFNPNRLGDCSPASLHAFRGWLHEKYGRDSRLRKAWRNSDVTLETASIPAGERRITDRLFLDRPEDTDIVDFNLFRSEGIVDTLTGYGRVLRDTHETPILLGTYYAGPAASVLSHRATGYLLEKKMFNYVTSVLTYGDIRWPGGTGKAHQAWSSLLLHGAFGLSEADFRSWKTHPSTPENDYQIARLETAEESNAIMRRDAGHMLAVGQGIWWYDMSGGWFNDPSIMRAVDETVKGYRADLKDGALPQADVAVFIDERSFSHLASADAATLVYAGINRQIVLLNSSGVPYHLYLQEDVANRRLPDYKLYVFLNACHFSEKEWRALRKLKSGGRTLAFVHAPGVVSGCVPDAADAADAVTRVTGIRVKDAGRQSLQLATLPGNGMIETPVNQVGVSAPTFAVDDADARPVAAYTNGQCAVAFKDCGEWKSLFFGGVSMNEFFFNALARRAGAWVAAPPGNAVYGSQDFLTVHALHPGEKEVRLYRPSKVTDLADGSVLAEDTASLKLSMKRGETRWFQLQKPSGL